MLPVKIGFIWPWVSEDNTELMSGKQLQKLPMAAMFGVYLG